MSGGLLLLRNIEYPMRIENLEDNEPKKIREVLLKFVIENLDNKYR